MTIGFNMGDLIDFYVMLIFLPRNTTSLTVFLLDIIDLRF